jgi:hypothetical protein
MYSDLPSYVIRKICDYVLYSHHWRECCGTRINDYVIEERGRKAKSCVLCPAVRDVCKSWRKAILDAIVPIYTFNQLKRAIDADDLLSIKYSFRPSIWRGWRRGAKYACGQRRNFIAKYLCKKCWIETGTRKKKILAKAFEYDNRGMIEYLTGPGPPSKKYFEACMLNEFTRACKSGNKDTVANLIKANERVHAIKDTELASLACKFVDLDTLKLISKTSNNEDIFCNANVLDRATPDKTEKKICLMEACKHSNAHVAEYLLAGGTFGTTRALNYSCMKGKLDFVKMLAPGSESYTLDKVFIGACSKGHCDVVSYLFTVSPVLQYTWASGEATGWALINCDSKFVELIKQLWETEPDPDFITATKVILATARFDRLHKFLSASLFYYGTEHCFNLMPQGMQLELFRTCCYAGQIEAVRLMIETSTHGRLLFRDACRYGFTHVLSMMKLRRSELNFGLFVALRYMQLLTARRLVELGAREHLGRFLKIACVKDDVELFKFLIDYGAGKEQARIMAIKNNAVKIIRHLRVTGSDL